MSTLLLEIGTEELPASFVDSAIEQWQQMIPSALHERGIPAPAIHIWGTPRRLAVLVSDLPAKQPDREDMVKGPPASLGFQEGQWTAAALGFARKQGVTADDLRIEDTDKGAFVFAHKQHMGQALADVLLPILPGWITGLKGERLMRWGSGELKFPRPIRWLVCLLDQQVLSFTLEGIPTDRRTWGHRILAPAPLDLATAEDYAPALRAAYVEVDPQARLRQIRSGVEQVAASVGGVADIPEALLTEVTQLVEWPTAVVGRFDPPFLTLPAALITMVMVTHQRYFPVYDAAQPQYLLPYFITISNGDPAKSEAIAAGNSRVIRARLADAAFFYREDQKTPLEQRVEQLAKVTFVEELGSIYDKVKRLQTLAQDLATILNVPSVQHRLIQRTALLCKADLVSQMVYEFPELQGVMGADYARREQEDPLVVQGIEQHYWPLGAGDPLPETITGAVVGLADRLDSLVGLFHLGRIPSGSSDRFALRRAANMIILVIWQRGWALSLLTALQAAADAYGIPMTESLATHLHGFFQQRFRSLLSEEHHVDYDLINTVLPDGDSDLLLAALRDPAALLHRVHLLRTWRDNGFLATVHAALTRCCRLANQGSLPLDVLDPTGLVDPATLTLPAEHNLWEACQTLADHATQPLETLEPVFAAMIPVIDQFFTDVLVMDPDPIVRQNRLTLIGLIRNHTRRLGDLNQVVIA
ncbi:MAG: glycine--tRNA ligase subunit beta [Synechococcales cyanobacterium]